MNFLTLKSFITFHYISFSSPLSFNSYNVYANPNMEIINHSDNVLDLGIFMSSNCSTSKIFVKMFKLVWLDLKNL